MQLLPKTQETSKQIPTPNIDKIILDVRGMKCAGCVRSVEKRLKQIPGVKSTCVNLATEIAVVECEVGAITPQKLAHELTNGGFPTQPRMIGEISTADTTENQRQLQRSAIVQLVIAGILVFFSCVGHFLNTIPNPILNNNLNNIWFHCGLATVALLIPGRSIIVDGWLGWRRGAPNMNTLVGLGTLVAYTASLVALLFPQMGWECFFDEPVMMLGFILLGRTLEQQARGRAASAFKQLLALQPMLARLIPNPEKVGLGANGVEIPVEQVRIGEWLQVLPGEKIPVDGQVVLGETTVDESMLTGEAIPVTKKAGDKVTASTLNQSGVIAIRATRVGSDTTIAQIVALVENAQTRKAPVQKLADTVAGYFTYGVLTASLLTFLFWYFIGTHIWHDITISTGMSTMTHHSLYPHGVGHSFVSHSPLLASLKLAISVMVVACPCALGLATPTAILVGTAMGAERGLLIKGGDILERVHELDTIVFDKTGTLTTGKPTVTDCIIFNTSPHSHSKASLVQLAAAVEKGTSHPLAEAIKKEALKLDLSIPNAEDFYTQAGCGVSALVDGTKVFLGNAEWLNSHGIFIDETVREKAQDLAAVGKTIVYVASGDTLVGLIAVSDTLRPDAKSTVRRLREIGLRVMLLSGDRLEAALAIAFELEIEPKDVIAGVPPAQKAAVIQSLQTNKFITPTPPLSRIAMVGDGINDAPALSQADIGIALCSGTEVAMETADIVLMRDSLTDVVESINLSRVTFNKIRQNLFWAFAYNTVGIPLAAGALYPTLGFILSPTGAAALMAFSSVSVVTNSLMLRHYTRNKFLSSC